VKIVVCIPARYASTRFPAKILARDTGKYLIQHTYEQSCKAHLAERVIIAADDRRIVEAARSFGAECVLTSPEHSSGTDRIAEAVADLDVDMVINVQGDEPEIEPSHINTLGELLVDNPDYAMATLASSFPETGQVADPNVVKVVTDPQGRALYFSRCPIPYDRESGGIGPTGLYQRHLGIYAYRKDFLLKITALPQTPLEKLERLEQLRALENGYGILVGRVEHIAEGIDTPEQYAAFVERWTQRNAEGNA
jgi:3-deoxy-manno-octulosonate cytidylyltransferase (CMP-KDO synthetase)